MNRSNSSNGINANSANQSNDNTVDQNLSNNNLKEKNIMENETLSVQQETSKNNNPLTNAKKTTAKSNFMKVQIAQEGQPFKEEIRKFGLLKQNRPIAELNVINFLQLIHNGQYDNAYPIITVEAVDLFEEHYELVDLEGNPIDETNGKEYLIVLDGQHRITAFTKLNMSKEEESKKLDIPNVHIKKLADSAGKYLASINMAGRSWTTGDKICVSSVITKNKLMLKINDLIKQGFNPSTATLICTEKRLTSVQVKIMISKGDTTHLPQGEALYTKLKNADKFYTICMSIEGMTIRLLTKRFFISGFLSCIKSHTVEDTFKALEQLTLVNFLSPKSDLEFLDILVAKVIQIEKNRAESNLRNAS